MPLSQIKAGMKGYGKTVFSGSTVKQFPIEVLGVVSKKDRPSKLVLIRASGPDIDKAGGLATGMSGTPIYVDGKLIGAFAFGWDFGDPKMGLVTPAEQMVSLFNYRDQVPAFPKATFVVHKQTRYADLTISGKLFKRYYVSTGKGTAPGAYPITSKAEEGPRSRFSALGIRVAPADMLELDMFLAPGSTLTISEM